MHTGRSTTSKRSFGERICLRASRHGPFGHSTSWRRPRRRFTGWPGTTCTSTRWGHRRDRRRRRSMRRLEYLAPDRVVTSPIATGGDDQRARDHPRPRSRHDRAPSWRHGLRAGAGRAGDADGGRDPRRRHGRVRRRPDDAARGGRLRGGDEGHEVPNVLRVLLGTAEVGERRQGLLIETNIDDMTPEMAAHALERLLAAGAQDAWPVPNPMKKGRPGWTLSALTDRARRDEVLSVPTGRPRPSAPVSPRWRRTSFRANFARWGGRPSGEGEDREPEADPEPGPEYDDAVKRRCCHGGRAPEIYSRATQAARALLESQRDGGTSS